MMTVKDFLVSPVFLARAMKEAIKFVATDKYIDLARVFFWGDDDEITVFACNGRDVYKRALPLCGHLDEPFVGCSMTVADVKAQLKTMPKLGTTSIITEKGDKSGRETWKRLQDFRGEPIDYTIPTIGVPIAAKAFEKIFPLFANGSCVWKVYAYTQGLFVHVFSNDADLEVWSMPLREALE